MRSRFSIPWRGLSQAGEKRSVFWPGTATLAGAGRLLAAALLTLALAASGCGKKESAGEQASGAGPGKGPAFHEQILKALAKAGLKRGQFESTAARPYRAEGCQRGEVEGLDVLLCAYGSEEDAQAAEKKVRQFIAGAVSGAVRGSDSVLLAVADRDKIDLQGQRINKVLQSFAGGAGAAGSRGGAK